MIEVKSKGLSELIEGLNRASENLPREVYSALNEAAKKTKKMMAVEVTNQIEHKLAQKIIKKQLKTKKDRQNLTVTVSLVKSWRVPLRDYGARQTKKGVTIANRGKGTGRTVYPHAFVVKKFGNHVYTRPETGERGPILKLKGVSPWGVLIKNKSKIATIVMVSQEEVKKQLADRIRYLNLKKQGQLNWQQNDSEE
jgi:hypothetical protein